MWCVSVSGWFGGLAFDVLSWCDVSCWFDVRCYIVYYILYYYILYYYILYIYIYYYYILYYTLLYYTIISYTILSSLLPHLLFLFHSILIFLPFPLSSPILSLPILFSSQYSFYTCRYLHILIYIQSFQSSHLIHNPFFPLLSPSDLSSQYSLPLFQSSFKVYVSVFIVGYLYLLIFQTI